MIFLQEYAFPSGGQKIQNKENKQIMLKQFRNSNVKSNYIAAVKIGKKLKTISEIRKQESYRSTV
jgi:hypothetical protein